MWVILNTFFYSKRTGTTNLRTQLKVTTVRADKESRTHAQVRGYLAAQDNFRMMSHQVPTFDSKKTNMFESSKFVSKNIAKFSLLNEIVTNTERL